MRLMRESCVPSENIGREKDTDDADDVDFHRDADSKSQKDKIKCCGAETELHRFQKKFLDHSVRQQESDDFSQDRSDKSANENDHNSQTNRLSETHI